MATLRRIIDSLLFRVAGTTLLLAVVAHQIEWGRMESRLRNGRPAYFGLAVLATVASLAVGAVRWWRLLTVAGIHASVPQIVRAYAISTFSGTFFPSSVGADVARALLLAGRGPMLVRVASTVVVDRIGSFVGLLCVAWICLLIGSGPAPSGALPSLAAVSAVAIVAAGVGIALAAAKGRRRILGLAPARVRDGVRTVRSVMARCLGQPGTLLTLLATSLVYQLLVAAQVALLARAIDVPLPFTTAAVAVTLVTIVTLVPISVGGFGLREGTYAVLLVGAGVSATDATLLSLMTAAALFVASLPGAVLLMRRGLPAALTAP